ncbi:MAG: tripeptide aminopeptidase [Solirubrobacteraceae bacterium]|nr:tripeptide aminopeptidase [Solirubrobacteraceae bacterium]
MPASPYTSPLAESLAPGVRERLLRYAAVGTPAVPGVQTRPSNPAQLELSRMLAAECEQLGMVDVTCDEQGYVMATVPASAGAEDRPAIGFMAHVDTSPDAPGTVVRPLLHEAYDGGVLTLPEGHTVLDPATMPDLGLLVGHQLITSSGDSLLGADDKAGIAAIMSAAELLLRDPALPRPPLRLAFTVDEEIGKGAYDFPLERYGATCAYTIDGAKIGEFHDETFSAAAVTATFTGVDIHPSVAKGKLVNALRVAADFVGRLPRDRAPETTDGRDGFLHPVAVGGGSSVAVVQLIVRDFDEALLAGHIEAARAAADAAVAAFPGASVTFESEAQYPNMRRFVQPHPEVSRRALEAIRAEGIEPIHAPVRGGTDGSILSERGLPTPNIFTGSGESHSVREWASVPWMAAAAAVIVHLAGLWAE